METLFHSFASVLSLWCTWEKDIFVSHVVEYENALNYSELQSVSEPREGSFFI